AAARERAAAGDGARTAARGAARAIDDRAAATRRKAPGGDVLVGGLRDAARVRAGRRRARAVAALGRGRPCGGDRARIAESLAAATRVGVAGGACGIRRGPETHRGAAAPIRS